MTGAVNLRSYVSWTHDFTVGTSSPRAYMNESLARITALEPRIGAFAACDTTGAAEAAEAASTRWRIGQPLSPIDGMPVAVKDIIETADMPTGQGSPIWQGTHTGRDAASVQALREAGAIILAKTTTNEFAGAHPFHDTRNPHDTTRTAGGSSSGSAAAVAAGMVPAALGSQVFCSILQPASYCGVVGGKPSYGAINRGGSYDQLSQSAHGALAATLGDLWSVLRAIADRVGGDPGYVGLEGNVDFSHPAQPSRLAVLETGGWGHLTSGAHEALTAALETLSKAGIDIRGRHDDPGLERLERAMIDTQSVSLALCAWENRWPLNTYASRAGEQLSPDSADRLRQARAMTRTQYGQLLTQRSQARAIFTDAASRYDAFLTLGATAAAPLAAHDSTGDPALSVDASYLGAPAVTLPLLHDQDLPLGLQLIGAPNHDAALQEAAAWITKHAFSQPSLNGTSTTR